MATDAFWFQPHCTRRNRILARAGRLVVAGLMTAACVAVRAQPAYEPTLLALCDALVRTQITDPAAPDRGALVCPSTNPQEHPLHPRAGEAVYPLAVAYRLSHRVQYRDAALQLARWMISKQQASGAWGEEWPKYDGWTGTTADQLISLAGALPMFQAEMAADDLALWRSSITRAANYVATAFPIGGNINYWPTGAVALELARRVVVDPPPTWKAKAESLIGITVSAINPEGFLVGEGNGVDLGYNLAQSIGYLAFYGQLTGRPELRDGAAEMLRTHQVFVYPNGSVDNSWGTRSFKWVYESGTKTAPGVYFSFALLADKDPRFLAAERRCFDFLVQHTLQDGLVTYGPHAGGHADTEPPCLYSTFARAQSLATAIQERPSASAAPVASFPGQETGWFRYFPSVKVAVVRTATMMATVSGYGEISRYGRGLVARGGSLTNLWIDGFGDDGFAQTSSVNVYKREERAHMPIEPELRPLTSRIEATIDGVTYSNTFEDAVTMQATQERDHVRVVAAGQLRSADGKPAPVAFRITHRFYARTLTKEYQVTASQPLEFKIIEPVVRQPGLGIAKVSPDAVALAPASGARWEMRWTSAGAQTSLSVGDDAANYWCPFPAVACVPVVLTARGASATVTATWSRQ